MNITKYARRKSHSVKIGQVEIGSNFPIAVQSMTNTSTRDTQSSVDQVVAIEKAGGNIVRLTAQGRAEAENLEAIVAELSERGSHAAIVADIHFTPDVALIAAGFVDKVRINPGNYRLEGGKLQQLIALCRERGVALRIGVNHGSLAARAVDKWGDTPEGMVYSALEFLEICQQEQFDQVVVSLKSSNTRVMVQAYRLLCCKMDELSMTYPIHLGVTEAGSGLEARVKSAVGIGALLADGIGDTIRVSLTEPPQAEVPVAELIADYFKSREGEFTVNCQQGYSPLEYKRRSAVMVPIIHSEDHDGFTVVESLSDNATAELRAAILNLNSTEPVMVKRRYNDCDITELAIKAAADLGLLFLDGLADGIWIDAPQHDAAKIAEIELMILQASRVRQSQTEYIACPSCGRTLFDIESRLAEIKERTSHLKHLKIGVMGCIVNGPGEMADADYGYVGAAAGHITLYRGREVIERNIPEQMALDKLVEYIKESGDWVD